MEPGLELFLFQEEGIRFASEREGALIADEMGLGKFIQAIGVINEDPARRRRRIPKPRGRLRASSQVHNALLGRRPRELLHYRWQGSLL